jgi:glycopeptide antibiotics resistance protein
MPPLRTYEGVSTASPKRDDAADSGESGCPRTTEDQEETMTRGALMTARRRVETVVLAIGGALYVAFLFKLLLFSRPPGSERSVNLIPIATIADLAFGSSPSVRRFAFANLTGNLILLAPLGVYLMVLSKRRSVPRTMLVVASVSVAVELVQGAFALGTSDIDDVILNCSGGLLGTLATAFVLRRAPDRDGARAVLAVLSLLGIPVLLWLLVAVKLRL